MKSIENTQSGTIIEVATLNFGFTRMATAKKNNKSSNDKDLAKRSRYPIGLLFQVSTLAACVSYLLFSSGSHLDFATAIYRALVVFVGVSVCLGLVMVTVVGVLHRVKMQETEDRLRRLAEEQLAEQQLFESQQRAAQQEREDRINQTFISNE